MFLAKSKKDALLFFKNGLVKFQIRDLLYHFLSNTEELHQNRKKCDSRRLRKIIFKPMKAIF